MIFFHLSHNDLDGYGCQLISSKVFKNGFYYNANYGNEVKLQIETILNNIANYKQDKIFFLISDLNLTLDEAKNLDKKIKHLLKSGYNIKLQLLDHHISGTECSQKYDWYYVDESRCATKIVYDYFKKNFSEFYDSEKLNILVEAINDIDIWEEEDSYFEFGKVLIRLINTSTEINPTMFPNENREYRLKLLTEAKNFIFIDNGHILLDENIYKMKKNYLNLTCQNDTIDNLSSNYLVHLLNNKKNELSIYLNNHKGLLTYSLSNISIPANLFLKQNPDFDFFININKKGSFGIRSNNKMDVSRLAYLLCGGGGHKNASGGFFEDFKESVLYSDVKKFLTEKLSSISKF